MNRNARLCATVAMLAGLCGCTAQGVLNAFTPSRGYSLYQGLQYGDAGQRLDVYRPARVRGAPVVVFFYGGRWSRGAREDYRFVGQALASQGFVAVLPDLRKYPAVRFPVFVQDAAKAVSWARAHAASYGGDPDKLFVMGHSSGAHIAALLALDPSYLEAEQGSRRWLRGMIGLAGPYDFMPITAPDLRDLFGPPERFDLTQPVNFCDGRNPPLQLLHGEDDDTVWVRNTRKLAQAVARSGGTVETVIYPEMSHTWILATLAAPLQGQSDVLPQVADFVRRRATAPPPPAGGPRTAPTGVRP